MINRNKEKSLNFILGIIFGVLLYFQILVQNLANLNLIGAFENNQKYIYFVIFIISLIFNMNHLKDLIFFVPFAIFGIISYKILRDTSVIGLFLVSFSLRRIEVYNIIKIFYYVYWSYFLTMMFLLLIRVTTNLYQTTAFGEGQGWTFGFPNHNAVGRVLMIGCILNLVLKLIENKRYSRLQNSLWWIIQIIFYFMMLLSASSGAIFGMIISLFCYFFISQFKGIKKARKVIFLGWVSVVSFIGSLIFTILSLTERVYIADTFWYNLNRIMTGRIALGDLNYKIFGMSIMGNPAYIPSTEGVPNYSLGFTYNFIDNSYLVVMIRYGIVFLIILLIFYLLLIRKIVKKQLIVLFIPIIALSIYGIAENMIYAYATNFVLLWLGIWLKPHITEENEENEE